MKSNKNEFNYVQYGCGFSAAEGWLNFDASPTLKFERIPVLGKLYTKNKIRFPENVHYGDIVKGLPVQANSCKGIYASHVLEHLALDGFRIALKNTYDLLAKGGIFRVVVPDMEVFAQHYLSSDAADACLKLMEESYLGREKRIKSIMDFLELWLGNSHHLWMWDYKSLENELIKVGFVNIRRCYFNDSSDEMFKFVENEQRFNDAVAIQCQK